eukprot:gene9973-10996_t
MAAPLRSIKVLELAGLAPVPMAGMILADFGASVIRIDKPGISLDRLARGKKSIVVDLKTSKGADIVERLCQNSDVLIEPFRPGVMEKLGLGPKKLLKINEKLIYARLTGFGQDGPLAKKAGHDINYLALSGLLSLIGRRGEKPLAPLNLLADFAGGSLTCVMGILLALFERSTSGKGQIVDCAMVEGAAYLGSFMHRTGGQYFSSKNRGTCLLDSGAPCYDTYETKDGKFVAVGALEPQFYQNLVQGLGLEKEFPHNLDQSTWPSMRSRFTEVFATKTQDEWMRTFENKDACILPVLDLDEAPKHPHNIARISFSQGRIDDSDFWQPNPAPKLSRSPAVDINTPQPQNGENTVEILMQEGGYSKNEVDCFLRENIVTQFKPTSLL